jgi:hypothetical protein
MDAPTPSAGAAQAQSPVAAAREPPERMEMASESRLLRGFMSSSASMSTAAPIGAWSSPLVLMLGMGIDLRANSKFLGRLKLSGLKRSPV